MTRKVLMSLFALVVLAGTSSAQKFKVESVKMAWESATANDSEQDRYTRIDECLADIQAAEKHSKTSNDPKMWYYRGVTYMAVQNEGSEAQKAKYPNALDIATESYFNCISTDEKDNYTSLAKRGLVNCAIGHYNTAVSSFNSGDFKQAMKAYETVLKIYPYDEEEYLQKKAGIAKETIMLYTSYAASNAGDNATAKKYLQELIDMAYGDVRIYGDMANILLEEKDTTGALDYIAKGRALDERNASLMRAELDLMMKLGRSEELRVKLQKAVQAEPESVVLHFAQAINYYNLDSLEAAEKSYLKVVELDPSYADAYYNLGVIYLDRCKPIADEIAKESDWRKQEAMEIKIDDLYAKAAVQFEKAMEVGEYDDMSKVDLAKNLKKLYARLKANNKEYKPKYEEMEALIESLGGE